MILHDQMPEQPLAEVIHIDFINRELSGDPLVFDQDDSYRARRTDNRLNLRKAQEQNTPDFNAFIEGVATVMSVYITARTQHTPLSFCNPELTRLEDRFSEEQWTDIFRVAARRIKHTSK